MAITYIGSTSRPDDGGTQGGNVSNGILVASAGPPVTGDLVVFFVQYRGNVTLLVSETSGQSWNSTSQYVTTDLTACIFWCRWDSSLENGNNPRVGNDSGSDALSVVAFIFRPSDVDKLWDVDTFQTAIFAAGSSPFTKTITGVTTTASSTVVIACWHTADDNAWSAASGSGWSDLGDESQYRNTTGDAQSMAFAAQVKTSAAVTGDVSKGQASNGGDAGVSAIIAFKEYDEGGGTSPISGSSSGSSTVTGALTGKAHLSGSVIGTASVAASITANGWLSGMSSGTSNVSGTLSGKGNLVGSTAGTATVIGTLKAIGKLSGSSAGVATATALLKGKGYLSGTASGISTAVINNGNETVPVVVINFYSKVNTVYKGPSSITRSIGYSSRIKTQI